MKHGVLQKPQAGVALLEALIAILLISFGILGIIGLQANSIAFTSDARYRVVASSFADRLIAEMWVDPVNLASYAWDGAGSPPAVLATWVSDIQTQSKPGSLPGSGTNPPTVTIDADNLVTVTVRWAPPQAGATVHNHMVIANINQDPEN